MKNIVVLALMVFLAGCGSTDRLSSADLSKPIQKQSARIIVERDTSLLYFGAAAKVQINGVQFASLGPGGGKSIDLRAGKTTISVTTPMAYGQFSISVDTKAGKAYKFVVSPRSEALLVGSAFGMIGDAVNASINENTGYFQVQPVNVQE